MQGKLLIAGLAIAVLGSPALASEPVLRQACLKGEQARQTPQRPQQLAQQQPVRSKPKACQVNRLIPSVVDPTPSFLL